MTDKKSLVDQNIESIAESHEISVEQATKEYLKSSDFVLNLDDLPKQKHLWTDRGLKWTCENAGHPYHEAWRFTKASI